MCIRYNVSAYRPNRCETVNWPMWNGVGSVENNVQYTNVLIWIYTRQVIVGAKEHPVYGSRWYLVNIYFLK